jgi:hypothetical protein
MFVKCTNNEQYVVLRYSAALRQCAALRCNITVQYAAGTSTILSRLCANMCCACFVFALKRNIYALTVSATAHLTVF